MNEDLQAGDELTSDQCKDEKKKRRLTPAAKLLEPNKCEGWEWVPTDQIPQPCFPPLEDLAKDRT